MKDLNEYPTPRTDEFYSGLNTDLSREIERDEIVRFARTLERENAALREALLYAYDTLNHSRIDTEHALKCLRAIR